MIRVKPGPPLTGVITSSKLVGVPTHYMSRRTLPCIDADCPGCAGKLPRRDEWYVSMWTASPSKHTIVALTPAVAWQIKNDFHAPATYRALGITLHRAGRAANTRLLVECRELETAQLRLPAEPDLIAHLLHIWGLDQGHLAQDDPAYVNRVKEHYRGNGRSADANTTG